MPQPERSGVIKEMLRWLQAKTKRGGAHRKDLIRYIQKEITEMGATPKRCMKYVKDCEDAGLLCTHGLKFKITTEGENWLKRKSLI